ncbi:DUF3429 domain-containing protein [Rhizobium paknamense]|uniref:DUF3429 domain-containing protein n=1 Tax=Rhizobium paknamense TaxID=1206817 RepID=A0ABU0IHU9_9HYPH|nr:DUF3429 domain-containing protein [Rhizobium paknamense]MDQ0457834.1 hypothetical protein [Rhizobium paknamense]
MPIRKLTQGLTFAGALPFYLALLPVLDHDVRLKAFLTYGAIIAAFMAGTLWGLVQQISSDALKQRLLLVSNGVALAIWGSLLIESTGLALALQLLGFLVLLAEERGLARQGSEPQWYWIMRRRITALVSAAYVLAFLFLA